MQASFLLPVLDETPLRGGISFTWAAGSWGLLRRHQEWTSHHLPQRQHEFRVVLAVDKDMEVGRRS